jgi:hypothetical protein
MFANPAVCPEYFQNNKKIYRIEALRICFTRAALSVAFLGLFGVSANGQLVEEPRSSRPPATGAEEIEQVFRQIDTKGTSYFYDGVPSKDFSHLTTRRAGLTFFKKDTLPDWAKPPVKFSEDYHEEVAGLRRLCVSLASAGDKFNAASWFMRNVDEKELPGLRRDFTEALYFSIGRLPDTREKKEALSRLNRYMPDSAAYIEFIQKKRDEVGLTLRRDPFLADMAKKWVDLTPDNKIAVLYYAAARILKTILPANDVDVPRILYLSNGVLPATVDGIYHGKFHEMYLNGDRESIATDFAEAFETLTHETFHAFQGILVNWYHEGKLDGHPQLKRQGKIQYLDTIVGGTGVEYDENFTGYRLSVKERGAWAFQKAAAPDKSPSIMADMFLETGYMPPVYKYDPTSGGLPQACGAARLSQVLNFY